MYASPTRGIEHPSGPGRWIDGGGTRIPIASPPPSIAFHPRIYGTSFVRRTRHGVLSQSRHPGPVDERDKESLVPAEVPQRVLPVLASVGQRPVLAPEVPLGVGHLPRRAPPQALVMQRIAVVVGPRMILAPPPPPTARSSSRDIHDRTLLRSLDSSLSIASSSSCTLFIVS